MEKTFKTIENLLLYAIVFLIPIIVLPIFTNAYITPKLTILTFGVALIVLLKVVRSLLHGQLAFHIGSFDIPLIALAATYVASLIIRTPNKMEGLFLPGTTTLIVSGVILYFLISQLREQQKNILKLSLISSGVVVAVISLLAISGLFKSFAGFPAFMKEPSFSSAEGSVQALIFFVTLVPLTIHTLVSSKDAAIKALMGTSAAVIVFGLIIALFNLLPGRQTTVQMPSLTTSWQIAAESIKQNPLLGIGPGNYLTAFNRFRPANYNLTNLWQTRFSTGRSFYFTVMTEVGLLGLLALFLLLVNLIKTFRLIKKDGSLLATSQQGALTLLLILFALLPASVTTLMLLFILLGLLASTHKIEYVAKGSEWVHKLPIALAGIPVVAFIFVFGYFASRMLTAESLYRQSLQAVVKNDGKAAYDYLRSTIVTNPYVDRYRASYAQVNLALAGNFVQKKNLSDDEKKMVSTLIQQTIREGKATVILNITRAGNWELLSNIYRNLMPMAKGADQYAIQTAIRAISLDPTNPNLRIYLGGLYYSLKNYDSAIDSFKVATSLKSDLPNAYYNLALAYREKGSVEQAIASMKIVVSLLEKDKDKNAKDYELAKTELDNLEKKKPSTPGSSDNLAPAGQTTPAPSLNPKLDLPEDANPPAVPEETATTRPSPSPTASPKSTE